MAAADGVPLNADKWTGAAVVGGGVAALLALLRIVYSALTGQRRFVTPTDIVLYIVLPAATAILLFASVRLSPIDRLRVVTAAVALIVTLYVAEGLLALVGGRAPAGPLLEGRLKPVMTMLADSTQPERDVAALAVRAGHPIDSRTPAQVIAEMRAGGVEAERIITATNQLFLDRPDGSVESAVRIDGHEVVPLGGVANQRTLLCNENGTWIDFQSDRHGFNNSDDLWRAPALDVAALGDSFTQGYCVPRDKNFVDLIRQRRPATLNLGISGDGPLMELATLEEFLPDLTPRTVLWFYFEGNDLTDLQTERRNAVLRRYLVDGFSQRELARQADIDQAMLAEVPRLIALDAETRQKRLAARDWGLLRFAKLTRVRDLISPIVATDAAAQRTGADLDSANMEVFRTIMTRARDRVATWRGSIYFVYLPEWSRYADYSSWGIRQRDKVLSVVGKLGIPIIDLDAAFRATGDPLSLFPFRQVGHYTEAGHRVVAQEVLRRLSTDERLQ